MSSNGNGKIHPFGGKPAAAVPIVGQPFTLKGWWMQLLVTCNCSARPEPLLIIGQAGAASPACPSCGRQIVLQGLKADAAGQLQFQIGATVPTPDGSLSAGERSDV